MIWVLGGKWDRKGCCHASTLPERELSSSEGLGGEWLRGIWKTNLLVDQHQFSSDEIIYSAAPLANTSASSVIKGIEIT